MREPDSLHELPMYKHHCTPGEVRRDSLDAYLELGEMEQHASAEGSQEVAADGE